MQTFQAEQSGGPQNAYDPVATGDDPIALDVPYVVIWADTFNCNYWGNLFNDSGAGTTYYYPPLITGLQKYSPPSTYSAFTPVTGTPQSPPQYMIIYGDDLTAGGASNPPTICVQGACSAGGAINVDGFHLGSGWSVTENDETGVSQINIQYWVDPTASTGPYGLTLQTAGGQAGANFDVSTPAPPPTVTIQAPSGFVSMAGNILVVLGTSGLTSTALTATGSPGGGTYSWSVGPNLTVSGANNANATLSATGPSASAGDTFVSVNYTLNGQKASASVRVTAENPTTFQAADFPGGSANTVALSQGSYNGYITYITYYVYDQLSPANQIDLPGISATEVLTTVSDPNNVDFQPPSGQPLTQSSAANGAVLDALYWEVPKPNVIPPNASAVRTQNWTINGYNFSSTQTQTYTPTYATISIASLHR